jgi:hypothetical protein
MAPLGVRRHRLRQQTRSPSSETEHNMIDSWGAAPALVQRPMSIKGELAS